jgi:hypothetical protein
MGPGMMLHACNPNTGEAESKISNLKSAWAIYIYIYIYIYSEILSQKFLLKF